MTDSIFPELNIDLQEQIDNIQEDSTFIRKTFLFDFFKGDFITQNGKLIIATEIAALENWIVKAIKTEKFKFKIYEEKEYGITLEDLVVGNKISVYIESEIKREIIEALLKHPQILSIDNWVLSRNKNVLTINFTVILNLSISLGPLNFKRWHNNGAEGGDIK